MLNGDSGQVMSGEMLLQISRVSKQFDGVSALRDVDLYLQSGEVQALIGANGSGKSTLVKILAGYHDPEPGAEFSLRGKPVRFSALQKSQDTLTFGFVHQELALIEQLTVLENFLLPVFASSLSWHIRRRQLRAMAGAFLARFGVSQLDTEVASVPRITAALLALAKAVYAIEGNLSAGAARNGKGILVLDEITAFLSAEEVRLLYGVVRETAREGNAVLFISHDLGEVMSFADTATVLRGGQVVGRRRVAETNADDLFELIVGRARGRTQAHAFPTDASEAVRVDAAGIGGVGRSSFTLSNGEIVGLTGLLGSGFDEIPYALFGALGDATGSLRIGGANIPLKTFGINDAMSRGIALVPGDRLNAGVIDSLSIAENVALLRLKRFWRRGRLRWRDILSYAQSLVTAYRIVARSVRQDVLTLSGGNQQRVLLAKWLETEARLYLLHDPVRGVDVEARLQIGELIRSQAENGATVLCATNDYEFLSEVVDRVLVYRNGTVVDELVKEAGEATISRDAIEWSCLNRGATTTALPEEAAWVEGS
jgi:ribose transport system ATP-binding protein